MIFLLWILNEPYDWIAMTVASFLKILLVDSFVKHRSERERATSESLEMLYVPRGRAVVGDVLCLTVEV